MEKVFCKCHGALCMLKTGVKEGPNKGKSFYVCVDKQGCDFSQAASLPPSHCLQHEDSTVELQALSHSQQQETYRLFYRCVEGKKAGQKWCGNVSWTAPSKEKRTPLTESQPQLSSVPPVRNPFKAPGRSDTDSAWRKIQNSAEEHCIQAGVAEAETAETNENENKHHHRVLPPGMKVKKGIPKEHRAHGDDPQRSSDQAKKHDSEQSDQQQEPEEATDKSSATSKEKCGPSGKATEKSQDVHRKPPTEASSGPGPAGQDDDVVLVSVQLPPPRPSSQSAVQKSLTAFPGFQKVSGLQPPQGDPQGLHTLLSSQLQQKKATLGAVNLDALPDKGARLKTQVKELEEALDALSLSASSHTEPDSGPSASAALSASAPGNSFSRPGGTVLLQDASLFHVSCSVHKSRLKAAVLSEVCDSLSSETLDTAEPFQQDLKAPVSKQITVPSLLYRHITSLQPSIRRVTFVPEKQQ